MNRKSLSLALLFAAMSLPVLADFTNTTDMSFRYALALPRASVRTIPDLSGHGRDAVVADLNTLVSNGDGSVTTNRYFTNTVRGPEMSNAKFLAGFTTDRSVIYCPNAIDEETQNESPDYDGDGAGAGFILSNGRYFCHEWTLVCWVRNIDFSQPGYRVIARGCLARDTDSDNPAPCYGFQGDNPFTIWLEKREDGIHLGMGLQTWNGNYCHASTAEDEMGSTTPFSMENDVWYQVAITFYRTWWWDGNYTYHLRGTVTPEGADELASTVATIDYAVNLDALATGTAIVLGAAPAGWWSTVNPLGYLAGEMAEATFFTRVLSAAELLGDVRTFDGGTYWTIDECALLHWPCDERAGASTLADTTGNGFDGTLSGNVECGFGFSGHPAISGFSTDDSQVNAHFYGDPDFTGIRTYFLDTASFDMLCWLRRPDLSSGKALIARGGGGTNGELAWEVFIDSDGAVNAHIGTWDQVFTLAKSEPLVWDNMCWYQVLIRRTSPGPIPERLQVWVTPAKKGAAIGAPVVDVRQESQFAFGDTFTVGASLKGWREEATPGHLGGRAFLSDISFVENGGYDFAFLQSLLPDWYWDGEGLGSLLYVK